MRALRLAVLGLTLTGIAACSNDGRLRDFSNPAEGPEEFAVVPNKPLQQPPSFAELPPPAPGGASRTDLTPNADAVAALGGNPSRLAPSGVPASDAALVASAQRYGVPENIRSQLAAEDAAFRRGKSRFTNIRIVAVDRYSQAYRSQALDPFEAQRQYRAAGARTPTAPPELR